MQLKTISLSEIEGSVYQPRLQDDRELRGLIASIRANGLRVPVMVQARAGKAGYLVVCGHRRLKALAALAGQGVVGLPSGAAELLPASTKTKGVGQGSGQEVARRVRLSALVLAAGTAEQREAVLTSFIENMERMDLSPYEQAVSYKAFYKTMGFSRAELCERLPKLVPEALDYMIAALDQKNVPAYMIKSWKERKLSLAHVVCLYRLRGNRARQKELYQMILDRQFTAAEANFWCGQLIDEPDRPLEERKYDLIEKRFLKNPMLKGLIDNKWLSLGRSRRGERIAISFSDVDELRQAAQQIVASLQGLNV